MDAPYIYCVRRVLVDEYLFEIEGRIRGKPQRSQLGRDDGTLIMIMRQQVQYVYQ